MLSPIIATLFADTKEYMAKMTEAEEKMGKFGKSAEVASGKFSKFAGKASSAVIGLGGAITAYGIEEALKFNEILDKIQNQSGASAKEIDSLKGSILNISSQTAMSSEKIGEAFLQVEKAGYRGKAAYNLVESAAKGAAITGGDVVSTTQSIIGIQKLQIARGMSVAAITDLMVNANKMHVGSLEQLTGVLQGKVGAQLAASGMNLAEMASISAVASQAGFGTAKAYTSLATGLEKVENPTASSSKQMKSLGLNAEVLAKTARRPGTGLVDVLKMLETQSRKTGIPMNTLIKDTFGPASIGLVSALAKNLNEVAKANKTLQKSSGADLSVKFGLTSEQLNFKLKQLEQQSKNALTGFGLLLLPDVAAVANWVSSAVKYTDKHPIVRTIATDAAIGIFASAVVFKIASGLGKVLGGLGKIAGGVKSIVTGEQAVTQISLLTEIAANTAAMVGEGTVEIGELAGGKTGIVKGIMSKLPAATLAELVPPLVGVVGAAYVAKTLMNIPGQVQSAAGQISSGSYLPQGKPMTGTYPSNGYYLNLGNGQSLFVPGSGAAKALSPTAGAGKTKVTLKATVK